MIKLYDTVIYPESMITEIINYYSHTDKSKNYSLIT